MDPYVTILMPVYNSEPYLKESIESLLSQTFSDFELLIVYDDSTDHSLNILNSYKDPRVRIVINPVRLGLIASLNEGLRLANGKYIARMDADDIALPQRLEKQVHFMDANPEIGVCGTWLETIGHINKVRDPPTNHEDIVAGMLFETQLFHPTVLIRRETILQLQEFYNADFIHAEDAEYWVRLESRGVRFANISEVFLKHRIHEGNISQLYREIQQKSSDKIGCRYLSRLGIELTKNNFFLFTILRHGKSSDVDRLHDVSKYIETILKANKMVHVFSASPLKQVIAKRWFRLCFKSAGKGLVVWRIYHENPISRCIKLTYTQKGLFFLKCVLRKNRLREILHN